MRRRTAPRPDPASPVCPVPGRQLADMAPRRHDLAAGAEMLADRVRLGRRFDDNHMVPPARPPPAADSPRKRRVVAGSTKIRGVKVADIDG